jgi:hypothetical protein
MIKFEFRDIMGRPYITKLDDEETAIIFAREMGLTYIGKVDE